VAAPSRAQRKRVALVLTLIVGSLLTGGWLVFRALDAGSAEAARSSKRLVVLPFTNLGPADDEYFADGITEEIATRLAAVDRFRVIGSTTASVYKGTRKTLHEIGTELGVDYVVQGAIRWQKSTRGPARVRVTPQLVSTADGTHLWGEVYDEPLDEIFRVQSDIAQKVVQALDITLPESQRRAMAAAPTANVEAYDYYLRGNDYTSRGLDERYTRAAVRMYERAVELDPQFALAYAMLARVHSRMYWLYYDRSPGRLAQAKQAVDTAFVLQPDLPEAHHSLGTYYWLGHLDYDRALPEFAIAAAGRPADSRVFTARAVLRTRQGNFREALADFERAWQLDPGSAWIANYAEGCELARTFARAEALYDRAIALSPDRPGTYARKAELYLRWEGNTQQARTVLDEARTVGVADAPFVLFARVSLEIFDRRYDEAIALLTSGAPEVFQDQFRFVPRALLYAQVYGLMQRHGLERAYYDSARIIVSRKLHEQPDDPRLRSALGIAYAGLGRNSEAIQEGERAVELLPVNKEAWRGYYHEWDLARVYAMVGQSDAALDRLEHLLSIPGHVTAGWLRIDPTWDPLRGHPRFQRLVDRGKWGIRGPPRVRILVTVP
jgi:serine/threonine-protein kinase